MESKQLEQKLKPRPPAALFALGHAQLPEEVAANDGVEKYRFSKLFKHDFFAATGLYERADGNTEGVGHGFVVLKVQRTYPYFGLPMKWLGRWVANHEIGVYEALQGIRGIPRFLGRVGETGFLHEFVPGVELRGDLPLTEGFFADLEALFHGVHEREVAYVDSNKQENILYGEDGRPWLIDFQISYHTWKGLWRWMGAKWMFRRLVRADWYHFYKHKTRLLPAACTAEDFAGAQRRGFLHRVHRIVARPMIAVRRRLLSRYDLANTR